MFLKETTQALTYIPANAFNIAGCPRFHGLIDDEQARFLGGVLGSDGLFGTAEGIYNFICDLLRPGSLLRGNVEEILFASVLDVGFQCRSHFEALAFGPKTLGWEVNPHAYSYAGKFHSPTCFEKAGGAGTFVWFDSKKKYICVYLTNYGRPTPFDEASWNQLIADLEPGALSDIIHDIF